MKVHLIPRALLKREFGKTLGSKLATDPRTFVLACGGALGPGGHHGQLDQARTLRVPRAMLPPEVEQFAAQHGLVWFLEKEYGPRVSRFEDQHTSTPEGAAAAAELSAAMCRNPLTGSFDG